MKNFNTRSTRYRYAPGVLTGMEMNKTSFSLLNREKHKHIVKDVFQTNCTLAILLFRVRVSYSRHGNVVFFSCVNILTSEFGTDLEVLLSIRTWLPR